MPKYKLTNENRKRIVLLKRESPCLTNAALARIFNISQSRVGEVLKADHNKYRSEK
jgi:predicted transcriptional regulator